MALILHIETATAICSVALADKGKLLIERTVDGPQEHARLLTVTIDAVMKDAGYIYNQLDAIAVSRGPGSYTGLRIGIATAKGLCFALEKPLIAVDTLYSMAFCAREQFRSDDKVPDHQTLFIPMIDARRMEVYTAVFDANLQLLAPVSPLILENGSFDQYSSKNLILFGDGASKYKNLINNEIDAFFWSGFQFSANGLIVESYRKYLSHDFVDTAYFEPFYLKDFLVGPKKP